MNDEPQVISSEGQVAIKVVEERYRPLLAEAEGEVRKLLGEGRWEVVLEGGILDYVPSHSLYLSVGCCRECCEDAPREERHSLFVSVSTCFLDGDRPLTDVGLSEVGFSFGAFQQLAAEVPGLSESSPSHAADDPGLVGEVEGRIVMLLRALELADAIDEDRWYDRE